MSARDQNIRFNFKALSELPTVIEQLEKITELTEKQGKTASASADAVKAALLQQRNDAKASAEENLAISKEIARQMTLDKKAQLEQQTAQVKASEAQSTAFVKAAAAEQIAIAKQLSVQMVAERTAELEKELLLLRASETRQTAETKVAHAERLASVRAALLEQAQVSERLHEQMTAELKAELSKQTTATKAEADQQTAIVRGEQQRQTLILRGELAEQRSLLKSQGAAYSELRNYIASAFGVYEVVQFGKDVIEAKSKVDIFRTGLQQMIGTKKEADAVYARLIEMAKTTPFQVENLMEATFSLKAMGTATSELLPTLSALGNMAAVVGSDKLGFIAKAFTDIQNKGKLMKQELNQFADNGVPLYDLLATSMGKTRDEVVKMADAHTISFAQVKKAIFDASAEGGRYYNLMAIQSQTLGGQVSNLADKFFLAKAKIGDYYQNGLQKVVSGLSDLVEGLAGSDSAIARNSAIIKAAASAWLTYVGVSNAAAISEGAVTAAVLVKNGVLATGQVIYGTYLLVMQRVTLSQNVLTASQTAATVAARGLWAALAANPLGVVIALVGALATAYYAYSAASEDVTTQLGEEALQIKVQQSSLNALAKAAMNAALGTKERKEYIDRLIDKYPEYFRGIDAERVSNNQLKSILDKVNGSYMTRISLARQAYKLEGLQDELKKNLQKEAEILATLPAELQTKYGGSITKAVADLFANPKIFDKINTDWKGQLGFGDFSFDEAKKVSDNLERIGKKMTEVDTDIAKSHAVRISAAERAENERWNVQQTSLKKGTDAYKKAEAAHLADLDKIRETAQKKEEDKADSHAGKMKSITLASQKIIKDILLQTDNMDHADKVKYYQNLEQLEIEQINKRKVSTKASEAEINQLRADALAEMQAIHEKYTSIQLGLLAIEKKAISESIQADIDAFRKRNDSQQEYITKTTSGFKQLADAAKARQKAEIASEKDVQAEREKTIRLMEQAADVEEKTRRKIVGLIANFVGEASPILGEFAKGLLTIIDHVDVLAGKGLQASQNQLVEARTHLSTIKSIYDAGIGGSAKQVEEAKQAVSESQMAVAGAKLETASAVFGVMGAVATVFQAIATAYNESQRAMHQAIADGMGRIREAYKTLYEYVQSTAEEAYRKELETFTGTLDEKMAKITAYYQREREFAEGRDRIDATVAYYQELAQLQADAGNDAGKVIEGMIAIKRNALEREIQMEISRAEQGKQIAADIRDAKIAAIEAASAAQIAAIQQEMEAERVALDARKAANEVFYSDKQLRLQNDDVYRSQLLVQGEAREVAALIAARERELQRARDSGATAEELARITIAFDLLIKEKHAEYQTAIGDKTKEISLANGEAKAQEKDKVNELESASAATIKNLQAQIAASEAAAALQKKGANQDYANAVIKANQSIFDAQKQLLIIQLRAEIAVLNSKKSWTGIGNGKINDAIGELNNAINSLNGINLSVGSVDLGGLFGPTGAPNAPQNTPYLVSNGQTPGFVYDKKGNPMELTYNPSGKIITVYDRSGNPHQVAYADGYVPATGERLFKGTESVGGRQYPDGIDTVPAWLTKGERVMTLDQNRLLGGVSNEELVQRSLFIEKLGLSLPDLNATFADIGSAKLSLPAGILNSDGGSVLDLSELTGEMRKTRAAIENQKLLSVNIDRAGFAVSEIGKQSVVNHFEAILKR